MRLRTFVLGMSALLLISFILILSQGPITPVVSVNSLRIEIVTDKEEYAVGERIHATLTFFNAHPHPVKISKITFYCVEGYHSNESKGLTTEYYLTPTKAYTVIQANSKYTFTRETFVSGYKGEYIIRIYGNAQEKEVFQATKIVTIHEESPEGTAWVVANGVTTVPSSMRVHNVTSEDFKDCAGVVRAIDRILRDESLVNASGIIDLPNIRDRWRTVSLSEAQSFIRYFGGEITEDKNVYIVYLRFIGDIYSILIRLE